MTIDPSGLPVEYADSMATVVGIYAVAVIATSLLAISLIGIARLMDWARARRAASAAPESGEQSD